MKTEIFQLAPPSLEELAKALEHPLSHNYYHSSASVVECPDLRNAPFHLAVEGLSGNERVADIGGQPNIFPRPRLECQYSFLEVIRAMDMNDGRGSLIGAGAGPFHLQGMVSLLTASAES